MTAIAAPNHPLAVRMAAIAFVAQNAGVGFMFGSFGLLLEPVEAKLGVARDTSSLGMALVMLGMALCAPLVGALSARISLRVLMMAGAVMSAAGYALLAVTDTVAAYLAAYGLLVGPGLALVATVSPATLVTRWFDQGRGRALGLVHMPIMVAAMPLACAAVLASAGLAATYMMLAGGMALLLLPLLAVVDRPPVVAEAAAQDAGAGGLSEKALLQQPSFWALTLAAAAISTGGTLLVTHVAPMVGGWGFDVAEGATLLSVMALAGIAGSLLFGWVADRLGGAITLAINCINQGLLWAVLVLEPSFPVMLVLIALIGVHAAAITATFGLALSQRFGAASFGRAFGLSSLLTLPFLVAGVPVGAWFYVNTGSYAGAIITQIAFYAVGAIAAIATARVRTSAPPARGRG